MAAGLEIIGSHGFRQITENHFNYVFRQKGSVNVTAVNTAVTFTYTGNTPLVCLRSTSIYSLISTYTVSGSTYTFTVYGSAAGTVEWFVFDQVPAVAAPVGLTVYKADGTVAYSTDYKPMRVQWFQKVPDFSTSAISTPVNIGVGRVGTFAVCMSHPRLVVRQTTAQSSAFYHDAVKMNASSVDVGMPTVQVVGGIINADGPTLGGYVMVVDVEGY